MSEPANVNGTVPLPGRPFPWYCPHCRRREVRRGAGRYECLRPHQGQPVTVVVPDLEVPQCGNCGELVFDYVAEAQVNRAYQDRIAALGNAATEAGNLPG